MWGDRAEELHTVWRDNVEVIKALHECQPLLPFFGILPLAWATPIWLSLTIFQLQGHLIARDGFLDTSLLPPFPQGFYQVSLVVTDTNSTSTDYVGTMKFFLQAMEHIKSKKTHNLVHN